MPSKKNTKKILIVEDDKTQVMIYQTAFENAGYLVISASNIRDAFEKIDQEKPDIILLDILLDQENQSTTLYLSY